MKHKFKVGDKVITHKFKVTDNALAKEAGWTSLMEACVGKEGEITRIKISGCYVVDNDWTWPPSALSPIGEIIEYSDPIYVLIEEKHEFDVYVKHCEEEGWLHMFNNPGYIWDEGMRVFDYKEDWLGHSNRKDYPTAIPFSIFAQLVGLRVIKPAPPVTELTMDDIAAKFNVPVSQLKIKK